MLPIVVDPRSGHQQAESGIETEWQERPMGGSISAIIRMGFCQTPQVDSAKRHQP